MVIRSIEKEFDVDFPIPEVIKVKTKFKVFYYNPIFGKWNFLYTTCPYCGKRARIRKKNIGENRFGRQFIYCNDCKIEGIIKTKKSILCPNGHLIENRAVYVKNKDKYFYCQKCGGAYLIMDSSITFPYKKL